jgi:hypothetical protein
MSITVTPAVMNSSTVCTCPSYSSDKRGTTVDGEVSRLRAGLSWLEIPTGAKYFFPYLKRPDLFYDAPTLLFYGYGGPFAWVERLCVDLIKHLHLVPTLYFYFLCIRDDEIFEDAHPIVFRFRRNTFASPWEF